MNFEISTLRLDFEQYLCIDLSGYEPGMRCVGITKKTLQEPVLHILYIVVFLPYIYMYTKKTLVNVLNLVALTPGGDCSMHCCIETQC